MVGASRATVIEEIEAAMLELLLKALGAYEGQLNAAARRAYEQRPRRDPFEETADLRRAARSLRDRAVQLGMPTQRYAAQEWRALGL